MNDDAFIDLRFLFSRNVIKRASRGFSLADEKFEVYETFK